MPRRSILTERQQQSLYGLPTEESMLLRHYVLSDTDLDHINKRRKPKNRLGFALQLCAFRYPGRLLQPGELIPDPLLKFVGAQLGLTGEQLTGYAVRKQTHYEHADALMRLYSYEHFTAGCAKVATWLMAAAENAQSNEQLATTLVGELRRRQIVLPAPSTLERLCADALVSAENRITQRITNRLPEEKRDQLTALLEKHMPGGITQFVWLRQFEPGNNSRFVNELLDRLDCINELEIPYAALQDIPIHRIKRLRRQGERYFADGMRDLPAHRRIAIIATCLLEWQRDIADAVIESHDRIVGKLFRSSERTKDQQVFDQQALIQQTLAQFADLGALLLAAHENGEGLEEAIEQSGGWSIVENMVNNALYTNQKMEADPLDYVVNGYPRFRRYIPRLLATLPIKNARAVAPLMTAMKTLDHLNKTGKRSLPKNTPISFARPKWRKRLQSNPSRKLWEIAVVFSMRDAFRSGDLWLSTGRRYAQPNESFSLQVADTQISSLAIPLDPHEWLAQRKALLNEAFERTGSAARQKLLPNGLIVNGELKVNKLDKQAPEDAPKLAKELYKNMPQTRITDLLLNVNEDVGFVEASTDLRTGSPCKDQIGLLTVLLSNAINLGLHKMAAASTTHTYWELLRIARWYVQDDHYQYALAKVIDAQRQLPLASVWGNSTTASADGQFFPTGGQGKSINLVNNKYSRTPGVKAYTHLSDQYGPFFTQTIPATAPEAPYIIDGLVANESGRRVREQYADTGGFTDHVFAMCSILGYQFAPRIRDLPSKRLYAFKSSEVHPSLTPLVASKVNEGLIVRGWPDVIRLAAMAVTNTEKPSVILKRLSAYSPQNEVALALREIGRVERSLFMLNWINDAELQQRAQMGLNKGEAHHALKRAISFNRRGEIRDRTTEEQHYRIIGMNLVAAIIIYWNTRELGRLVQDQIDIGNAPDAGLLPHVSPLGWEHILLSGEYRWPKA
jgi:TnpA family transposase